jgi:hypothetical protein
MSGGFAVSRFWIELTVLSAISISFFLDKGCSTAGQLADPTGGRGAQLLP